MEGRLLHIAKLAAITGEASVLVPADVAAVGITFLSQLPLI